MKAGEILAKNDIDAVRPRRGGNVVWGIYAWILFVGGVLCAVLFTVVVPGLDRRRRCVTAVCRGFFQAAGIPASVSGLHHLPEDHCIVVANHASYVDGVILQAFLPPRFAYVIKGEMRNIPVVHFLLRRIGSRFVERYVTSGSARDARALLKAASSGESLAFFPEGTFIATPGLGRFRHGAFAAALKAGLPVVPVVISGSRKILSAGQFLPRHGGLELRILPAIVPDEAAYASASKLAREARRRILSRLNEPDLIVADDARM